MAFGWKEEVEGGGRVNCAVMVEAIKWPICPPERYFSISISYEGKKIATNPGLQDPGMS